jgi:hypothetical protein
MRWEPHRILRPSKIEIEILDLLRCRVDRQVFIDRILETENLTDNLEDKDANTLLNWGITQVDVLMEDALDPESAGERVSDLMHVMRGLNALAGNPARVTMEAIADILNRYSTMIGRTLQADEDERRSMAERVSQMQPGAAVRFLIEWLQTKKP